MKIGPKCQPKRKPDCLPTLFLSGAKKNQSYSLGRISEIPDDSGGLIRELTLPGFRSSTSEDSH